MATSLSNIGEAFIIDLVNADDLKKLFADLKDGVQMKVLNAAFKKSGKIILDAAKTNFQTTKKGFSKTNYADFRKSFKSKALKKDIGMIFGMQHREGYKYRFINFGTKERYTRTTKRFTGIIKPSSFFTSAVESKTEQAQAMLAGNIVESLERLVNKYEK